MYSTAIQRGTGRGDNNPQKKLGKVFIIYLVDMPKLNYPY